MEKAENDRIIHFETKEGQEYFDELEKMPLAKLMNVWDKTMEQLKEIDERNENKIVRKPRSSYGHTFR